MNFKILIIIIILIGGCSQPGSNKIRIVKSKDKAKYGDTLSFRLYVDHNHSINPDFRIIVNGDTARLPVDELDDNCGVFNIRCGEPGLKKYYGFVKLVDTSNKERTIEYKIKFRIDK